MWMVGMKGGIMSVGTAKWKAVGLARVPERQAPLDSGLITRRENARFSPANCGFCRK